MSMAIAALHDKPQAAAQVRATVANALRDDDKAAIDYLISQIKPPQPPDDQEIIADFLFQYIGASNDNPRTITVSKSWPGWMIDTLAVAWKKIRTETGFNNHPLIKSHKGGGLLLNHEVPVLGTIEVDYQKEQTEVLKEVVLYCDPLLTAGLVVKADFSGAWGPPTVEIRAHEQSRAQAQKLINHIDAVAKECNLYRGKHLNVVSGGRIKFAKIEPAEFSHIIMTKRVIDLVKANTVDLFASSAELKKYNVGTSHATILAGVPGTGKTMLGRAVATALGSSVTSWLVTAKAFYSAYDVVNFYEMVRAIGPSFVLFEDLDLVGRERSGLSSNDVLGELLNQMSGTSPNEDIITLASTNDITELDAALSDRPERLGTKIDVPLPGKVERRKMFDVFASRFKSQVSIPETAWASILEASEGLTGDYIRAVTRLAVRTAISESKATASADTGTMSVTESHLSTALAEILRSKSVGRKTAPTQPVVATNNDNIEVVRAEPGYSICIKCAARVNQRGERLTPPEKHAVFRDENSDE